MFHRTYDGNAGEVAQVVEAMKHLRELAGPRRLLLVGDSKLVSYTNVSAMIDAVTGRVDAALQACAQAGQRGLPMALTALRGDVIETRGRLEESKNACGAERQAVEAWRQVLQSLFHCEWVVACFV